MAETFLREIADDLYVPKKGTKRINNDLYEVVEEEENELYDDFENPIPLQG